MGLQQLFTIFTPSLLRAPDAVTSMNNNDAERAFVTKLFQWLLSAVPAAAPIRDGDFALLPLSLFSDGCASFHFFVWLFQPNLLVSCIIFILLRCCSSPVGATNVPSVRPRLCIAGRDGACAGAQVAQALHADAIAAAQEWQQLQRCGCTQQLFNAKASFGG